MHACIHTYIHTYLLYLYIIYIPTISTSYPPKQPFINPQAWRLGASELRTAPPHDAQLFSDTLELLGIMVVHPIVGILRMMNWGLMDVSDTSGILYWITLRMIELSEGSWICGCLSWRLLTNWGGFYQLMITNSRFHLKVVNLAN